MAKLNKTETRLVDEMARNGAAYTGSAWINGPGKPHSIGNRELAAARSLVAKGLATEIYYREYRQPINGGYSEYHKELKIAPVGAGAL